MAIIPTRMGDFRRQRATRIGTATNGTSTPIRTGRTFTTAIGTENERSETFIGAAAKLRQNCSPRALMTLQNYSKETAVTLVVALALACASAARGDEAGEDAMNRVSLQAESSKQVANDLMQAVLSAELEDRSPAKLADMINQAMTWALAKSRNAPGITVQSGGYQTYPIRREGAIVAWRASQQLRLESSDTDRMTVLIGELQSRLQLGSLTFTVSREVRRATENELIDAALDIFKQRAEIVRENLAAASYRIVEIDIRTSGAPPRPPAPRGGRHMALHAESVTRPAVEAGSSEVSVSVSGTIQLD
ncbi:MAG: DUF541 domain-containing protein [Deltaproteobacteria bacterium]|nr:MAG: DUF541 domain-containing protein [Deltaproteobacteria bacterium]